jgi:AAA15 family ATPase/GTPase
MLVRFSVENFLSFRDRVELSMVASKKVRRHPEHVIRADTPQGPSLLKLAVIYGANASGKSNLIKALAMPRELMMTPPDPARRIPYSPFKLDPHLRKKPSRFELEITFNGRYYAYGLAVTSEKVEEEWLFEICHGLDQKIFERESDRIDLGEDLPFSNDEKEFLASAKRWVLPNRLFLADCWGRNLGSAEPGSQSIKDIVSHLLLSIIIVFPDYRFGYLVPLASRLADFKEKLAHFLRCFDTGIEGIDFEETPFDKLPLSESARKAIEADLDQDPYGFGVSWPEESPRYLIARNSDGTIVAWKWGFRHGLHNQAGGAPTFDLEEESDGTQRLMHLVPLMLSMLRSDQTIAIDELDRSLHPDILHSYLANFLKYSAGRSSQLIVTTHDTTLLKQPFIRRDEVWFVEKGADQSSRLIALEEYKDVDKSKDLQQDYLLGRFGGVPVIRDFSWLGEDHGEGA